MWVLAASYAQALEWKRAGASVGRLPVEEVFPIQRWTKLLWSLLRATGRGLLCLSLAAHHGGPLARMV